jgi:hypothetical protein
MEANNIFILNDLKLGDLVERKSTIGIRTPLYVIGENDLMLIDKKRIKSLRTYFPIKISVEILKVFNFKEVGKNVFLKKIDCSDLINFCMVYKNNSEYSIICYRDSEILNLKNNKLDYIHNLQTLIKKLYNKELTIK